MSRKQCKRRQRPVYADPMQVARNQAGALTPEELGRIMGPLRAAFDRLRQGVGSDDDWAALAGGLGMACNIERQGVVRGLQGHLSAADHALRAVEARASAGVRWHAPELRFDELEAIGTFLDLHDFQLRQLGYAEFRRALAATVGQARQRGVRVEKLGEAGHA